MKFINLTPHTITEASSGKVFPPSGQICRVSIQPQQVDTVGGHPIYESIVEGDVTGLPEPKDGVCYIVSSVVYPHIKDRDDVYKVGRPVRNNGEIVGCIGFSK